MYGKENTKSKIYERFIEFEDPKKVILYMTVSNDEKQIAVCIGKKLIKEELLVTDIVVYSRRNLK